MRTGGVYDDYWLLLVYVDERIVLTLGHDGVSLADPLQGLQLYLPLFEDVENSVRPRRFLVAIQQPKNNKTINQ